MLPVPLPSRHYKGCVRIGLSNCKQGKRGMQSSLLATMTFLLVIISFAQAQAGVGDALRESMLVDGKNPTRGNFRKWTNLDAVGNLNLVEGEKVLERGAKASKETAELTLTEWAKRKGLKPTPHPKDDRCTYPSFLKTKENTLKCKNFQLLTSIVT